MYGPLSPASLEARHRWLCSLVGEPLYRTGQRELADQETRWIAMSRMLKKMLVQAKAGRGLLAQADGLAQDSCVDLVLP